MEVHVKVNHGKTYIIEVGLKDTVFNIKEKVTKALGLSAPNASLYFKGILQPEYLSVQQCQIHDKSRVEVLLNIQPNELNRQLLLLHQATQSSQVSSVIFNNQDSTLRYQGQVVHRTEGFPVSRNTNYGFLGSQDQSVMPSMVHQTNQFQASPNLLNQYPSVMASSGNQMFHQNNQFQAPPNLLNQYPSVMASSGNQMLHQNNQYQSSPNLPDQYRTIMPSSGRNDQMLYQNNQFQQPNQYWSLMGSSNNSGQLPQQTKVRPDFQSVEEFYGLFDIPASGNNQAFQTEQSPVPLRGSFTEMLFGEDQPEDFANIQSYWPKETEKPAVPSNAGKEIIGIPDPPVRGDKIRILILSENGPEVKFPVYVNPRENVSELRKELVKIEGLILPEEGYFFISKNGVVYNEEQSFLVEGIGHGDTLDVFPGKLINDPRPK